MSTVNATGYDRPVNTQLKPKQLSYKNNEVFSKIINQVMAEGERLSSLYDDPETKFRIYEADSNYISF